MLSVKQGGASSISFESLVWINLGLFSGFRDIGKRYVGIITYIV